MKLDAIAMPASGTWKRRLKTAILPRTLRRAISSAPPSPTSTSSAVRPPGPVEKCPVHPGSAVNECHDGNASIVSPWTCSPHRWGSHAYEVVCS